MSVVLPFPHPEEEENVPDEVVRVRKMALELTRLRFQPPAQTFSLLVELKQTLHAKQAARYTINFDDIDLAIPATCKRSGR